MKKERNRKRTNRKINNDTFLNKDKQRKKKENSLNFKLC